MMKTIRNFWEGTGIPSQDGRGKGCRKENPSSDHGTYAPRVKTGQQQERRQVKTVAWTTGEYNLKDAK